MLLRLSLFATKKDFFIFFVVYFLIFSFNLALEYNSYKKLTSKKSTITKAYVLKQYLKHKKNKTYQVLKLKTASYAFYTTASKKLRDLKDKYVLVKL